MVCIPCIVIPVLLWVYKRFLEPVISPLITPLIPPFISRFWTKAAVQDTGGDVKEEHEKRSPAESNGVAHGSTANGPKTVADKKAD